MQHFAIHSAPRSGSTWLGEIINASPKVKYCYQPLFSYALKNFLTENSSLKEVDDFFIKLQEIHDDRFLNQQDQRDASALPVFAKDAHNTHVGYKEVRYHNLLPNLLKGDRTLKIILLIRNPVEVMDSWVGAPKEFDTSWDFKEQLLTGSERNQGRPEEFFGLYKWIEASSLFQNLHQDFPERTMMLNYYDLKKDTFLQAKRIYDFFGLNMTEQTQDFLHKSTTHIVDDTYSVFRGSQKKTIKNLNEEHIDLIKKTVLDAGLGHYLENGKSSE